MVFPATNLSIGVELYIDATWTDVTSYVYQRDAITISRGRADEGNQPDPAKMNLTLDNRDGRWSPRNPTGTYFGKIGRNSRIRMWEGLGEPRLRLVGADQFECNDSAALSITGDIDLRVDLWRPTWRPGAATTLGLAKGTAYFLRLETTGKITIGWLAGAVAKTLTSSEPPPGGSVGRKSIRVTLDVNNGAAGHTGTFYYSSDQTMDGTWTAFGTAQIGTGTTSIDNTADKLTATSTDAAEVNEIRVYDGIGGTKRASPKFTTQTSGTVSFADAEANTWTPGAGAAAGACDNRQYRFWGEVTTWPQRWDISGSDIYSPIECAGMTRRMGQGERPLASALRRAIPDVASTDLVAYCPLEDGANTVELEAAVTGQSPAHVLPPLTPGGNAKLAAYDGFPGAVTAPTLNGGIIVMIMPGYVSTDEIQVRFMVFIPTAFAESYGGGTLATIYTSGTLAAVEVDSNGVAGGLPLGTFRLNFLNKAGGTISSSADLDATEALIGKNAMIGVTLAKNGADVDATLQVLPAGADTPLDDGGTSVTGYAIGVCTKVQFGPGSLLDVAVGHATVEKNITTMAAIAPSVRAFTGEEAHDRISRLCTENGITADIRGASNGAETMGYQGDQSLLDLLREAAVVDDGILVETRRQEGLLYRTHESLYNQDPAFTLDYTDAGLADFVPVDDDQHTRNKVTVSRSGGSSWTVEDTTSPMSTADPPSGAGLYDEGVSLPLAFDGQAATQAAWRVHLGTVNESRWPQVTLNLAHPVYSADQTLTRAILTADCGDVFTVTDPPSWLPPESINQMIQGYTEKIWQKEHTITFNCTPANPYTVAVFDSTGSRYINSLTVTAEALDTTETGIDVSFTSGPIWTDDDGSFDIMIDGERMTVTAVAGAGSPQTFTVTRSVNGVVKSHASGLPVRLFTPTVYGM